MERYQVIAIAAIIPVLVNWLLHRISKEPEEKEDNEKTCRMGKNGLPSRRWFIQGLFRDKKRCKPSKRLAALLHFEC